MNDGFTVLLDKRRFCVLHRDEQKIHPEYRNRAPRFDFTDLDRQIENDRTAGRLSGRIKDFQVKAGGAFAHSWLGPLYVLPGLATPEGTTSGTIANYHDPVTGGTYLAGYAQMSDDRLGWTALVQHDRAAVLKPIDELRGQVWGAG